MRTQSRTRAAAARARRRAGRHAARSCRRSRRCAARARAGAPPAPGLTSTSARRPRAALLTPARPAPALSLAQLGEVLVAWAEDVRLAHSLTSLRAQLAAALRARPGEAAKPPPSAGRAAPAAAELPSCEALVGAVRQLVALERSVCEQLAARPHLAAGGGRPLLGAGQSLAEWCAEGCAELVGLEQRLFSSARTFSAAAANVAAAPAQFMHRAVSLFQRLFDVPELDELFERIWAVHLLHADAKKLHGAACGALGVPAETPAAHVLKLLREVAPPGAD